MISCQRHHPRYFKDLMSFASEATVVFIFSGHSWKRRLHSALFFLLANSEIGCCSITASDVPLVESQLWLPRLHKNNPVVQPSRQLLKVQYQNQDKMHNEYSLLDIDQLCTRSLRLNYHQFSSLLIWRDYLCWTSQIIEQEKWGVPLMFFMWVLTESFLALGSRYAMGLRLWQVKWVLRRIE